MVREGNLAGAIIEKWLAKWLFKDIDILIVEEPTHGIDVNAKTEVYELFCALAASGKSIIMISSEMLELISLSDRIIVIRNFEISKEHGSPI